MHHAAQPGGEALVEAEHALVLEDLHEGVRHPRVVAAGVQLGRATLLLLETDSKRK